MESKGRKIHARAVKTRERGDPVKALKFLEEAMAAHQRDGDDLGFAEALGDQFLTLRHLFGSTGDRKYLIRAKYAAMAGVEIAEESGDRSSLAFPQFNLAKALETLGELPKAVKVYKEALDNVIKYPPGFHRLKGRPAVALDFEVHLYICKYMAGEKSALQKAEHALSELEKHPDIANYNQHVWVSGGHMKIAEMLKEDNPKKAKEHLQKAKDIIDSDPSLTIRLSQWQKLAEKFT